MSVIKIKNELGQFIDLPVLQGPPGKDGNQGQQGDKGNDGISITTIVAQEFFEENGYTKTPIVFNKSDNSQQTINISAKNGSAGTMNYLDLENKPKINNVELINNVNLNDLGIQQTMISTEEPQDLSVKVWIDPSESATFIPTKTSDLLNDSGFISQEVDPTVPNHVKNITQTNINNWNAKSNFSGSYNDLTDKPIIPTKVSQLTNDSNYATENWVEDKISNIQPSGGSSSSYETVINNTINNGITQNINIDFDNSYNELIVYIDLGGNNKQLGSVFWKINNVNTNFTGMQTYRYYHAKYTVTPLFTMFDVSSSNNNQAGYNVVRGQSANTNKISNFSISLGSDLYFPNGTKVQILGR